MSMHKIHFDYYKTGEKNFVRHHLDIFVDGDEFAVYESAKKTDLSPPVYDFYAEIGVAVKPVFDGVDFPDCAADMEQLRALASRLSDFRQWKKKKKS